MNFKLILLILGAVQVLGNTTADTEYYYPDEDNGALLIKSLFYKINTLLLANNEINKQFLDINKQLLDINKRLDDQTELLKNIPTKNNNDGKLELQTAYQKQKNQTDFVEQLPNKNDDLSLQLQNIKNSLEEPVNSFKSMHRSKCQDYIKEKNLDKNSVNQISDWIVIQRREDATVNFNRKWEDYKIGFGDPKGNFFIGLEKLHEMTSSGVAHELLIVLKDFNNETRYAKYDRFLIDSEKEKYAMKELGEYSGDAGDSLTRHSGMKFTTADQDTEGKAYCATIYNGGWWFIKCCVSSLNGSYKVGSGEVYAGIIWETWHGHYYSLKFSEMMIRLKQ